MQSCLRCGGLGFERTHVALERGHFGFQGGGVEGLSTFLPYFLRGGVAAGLLFAEPSEDIAAGCVEGDEFGCHRRVVPPAERRVEAVWIVPDRTDVVHSALWVGSKG